MNEEQWRLLLSVINGEAHDPLPVGFIIDSPWLPGWAGHGILDYYSSETVWLECNLEALRRFPQIMFLPGFWSEYGMCTEPSAFGAKCIWHENDLPFAETMLSDIEEGARLKAPNPLTDGLAPFVLKRLERLRPRIEEAGCALRFATARGPLNVASFMLGATEFLMQLRLAPDAAHALLATITDYLVAWLKLQAERLPTIEGVLVLDDIVGFIGDEDFTEFAKPYLRRTFEALDVPVRFFHNDAGGRICAPHLAEIGVNLFNFSHNHSIAEMRGWTGDAVTLLGNLPPRDVLAQGSPDDVRAGVGAMLEGVEDRRRLVLSCGGGMPPDVSTENIETFLGAAGHAV